MEQWDIYDENKQKTGRTMNRNDWNMQPGDFHPVSYTHLTLPTN